jgi:hypothetical protein
MTPDQEMTPDALRLAFEYIGLREIPEALPATFLAPWPAFKIVGDEVVITLPANVGKGLPLRGYFKVSDWAGIEKYLS